MSTDTEIISKLIEHLQGFIQLEEFLGNTGNSMMGKHITASKELINTIMLEKFKNGKSTTTTEHTS